MATGLPVHDDCEFRDEWFIAGASEPNTDLTTQQVRIRKPSHGLMLAMDPRIPDASEYFEFAITDDDHIKTVNWYINNKLIASTGQPTYHWKLSKGTFSTQAEVIFNDERKPVMTERVEYKVN